MDKMALENMMSFPDNTDRHWRNVGTVVLQEAAKCTEKWMPSGVAQKNCEGICYRKLYH